MLALIKSVVEDPGDPFRVADLAAEAIRDDPALLHDAAAALTLTGGRRVVRLRGGGDALAPVFADFLARDPGDALVVVEAGELRGGSKLRRVFEGADNAAALACYADDGNRLDDIIAETLAGHGLRAEPAALAALRTALGGDRLTTRAELDKLAAYVGAPSGDRGAVTLADVEACVGDAAAVAADAVAIAACGGDLIALDRGLGRAALEGIEPITLLRALQRHLRRLHRLAGAVAAGKPPETALRFFRPPLHFRVAKALRAQVGRWPGDRAVAAMERVVEAEITCKSTGMPAASITARTLLRIAVAARR